MASTTMARAEVLPLLAEVGIRLTNARHRTGLTQEQVAVLVGCSTRSIIRWENASAEVGVEMICRLAHLYGVTLEHLLRGRAMSQARP